jgi:hypothetical protein
MLGLGRHTLESAVASLVARVNAAVGSKVATARWWARDLAVWRAGKLVGIVRKAKAGRPVVTVMFDTE